MADTRNNITIPQGAWVDLLAGSGVMEGSPCTIYNKGSNPVFICYSYTAPALPTNGMPKGIPLYVGGSASETRLDVPLSTSGLWGYCENSGGSVILVQD